MKPRPILIQFSILIAISIIAVITSAQEEVYDLMYTEYVSPSQSYLIQHPINGDAQIFMSISYPADFDALLHSPLNGIYAIFDNQAHLMIDDVYVPQFDFPLIETVEYIREITINIEDYPDLDGTVITNSAILSHDEKYIGFDMTTLDDKGRIGDEFVAVYHIEWEILRIIEIEDPDIISNRSIDNLRWSPDDTILAYYYPTNGLTVTEHITLVSNCVSDIQTDCEIERLNLPSEAPVMESFDWSPDGAQFAISCAEDHLDPDTICIINTDGVYQKAYDLSKDTHKFGLEWSPDGQWIAYMGQNLSYTQQDIYALNVATGEEINISNTLDSLESVPFWVQSGF